MNINTLIRKQTQNILSVLFATAGTLCLPQILNLRENILGFTNSIFAIIFWLLSLYMIHLSFCTINLQDQRGWLTANIFSFFFTAAMLFGTQLESTGSVDFKNWRLWISLPALTCFFAIFVRMLWELLHRFVNFRMKHSHPGRERSSTKYGNLLTFFFLLLCWLPVLFSVYPGFFVYDANDEWAQVASRTFNTHHPLIHVLILGGSICAVHKITGSYNLGIAFYIITQMAIVACSFTYLLSYMRQRKIHRIFRTVVLLYFAFFPVIIMFTLCSTKDTLFTTALLMLLLSLLDMNGNPESFFSSRKKMVHFSFFSIAMMLLRKNGVYAFILTTPFLLYYHKKHIKKLSLLILTALLSYFLVDSGLTTILHAEHTEKQEILTVPIQQLARAYHFDRDSFEPDDIATLHEILPEEALAQYRPKLSDPVKVHFQNDTYLANKSKYIRLWLRIGFKKPMTYVNAWLVNSYGFWYPDTVIDVYSGNTAFTYTYKDNSYFGYEVEEPGIRQSKISWLAELYRKLSLEIAKEKIPICSMFFSPGFMFWFFMFVFFYLYYQKRYHLVVSCLIVFFVWFTVILGPTYLPRYVLIFWYGLPLFAMMLLNEI